MMEVDVVTIGEAMGLLTSADPGPLLHRPMLRLGFGGAETNVAIGVARLGLSVKWIGRVGPDEIGDLILRELRAEGVSTACVRDASPTGLMLKTVSVAGKVRVTYFRTGSAGSKLALDDIDEGAIREAKILHVTGITPALGPGPAAAVSAAVEIARAHGVTVSLDLNYRESLWDRATASAALGKLAKQADVLFATHDEAGLLVTGETPAARARALADLGPRDVIVKLGAAGSVAHIEGQPYVAKPALVTAVDAVGAGDAFAAGYLVELVRGLPAPERLATASTSGAFAVAVRGDWEGLPTRAELYDFSGHADILR